MKLKLFSILFLVTLAGCGKPNIEHDCTINGNGVAGCSFGNSGDAKGSVCLEANVIRTHSDYTDYTWQPRTDLQMKKINEDAGIDFDAEVGSMLVSTKTICSGLVEPQDVVDREKSISPFVATDKNGKAFPQQLNMFCWLDDDNDYGTYYSGAWHRGCSIVLIEKPED